MQPFAAVNIIQKHTYTFRLFQFKLSELETWIRWFILEPYEMMAVILLNSLKPLSTIDHAGPAPLPAISHYKKRKKRSDYAVASW